MNPPVRIKWHQGEGFPQAMPDDQWLEVVGAQGWVVLSQDRKFHLIEVEAKAIKQHKIRCFYLRCASEPKWVSLCNFVRKHEKMIGNSERLPAPFIYELKSNGQFYPVPLP